MEEFWINNQKDLDNLKDFIDSGNQFTDAGRDDKGHLILKFKDFVVHIPGEYDLSIKAKDADKLKYDPLIFGKDQTENIVNITVNDDETTTIHTLDGCKTIPYKKWAIGSVWTEGATKFKGYQYYKFFKELTEGEYQKIKEDWNFRLWTARTPEEGFMLKNGYTYYKGMNPQQVSLYSLDIEATTINPDKDDALVVLMSRTFRDRNGVQTTEMFDIFDYDNVDEMYFDIHHDIKKCDPDIMLGHNIFGYDLPYLEKTSPAGLFWGRGGQQVTFDEKNSKFRKDGSQTVSFKNAHIHGRDIIDTMFLSIKYDLGRDFPSYGLKAIEEYLGIVGENRIDWDFNEWPVKRLLEERAKKSDIGIKMWNKFRDYCQDDTLSPIIMFDKMIPAFFYLAQSVPKTIQQIINEASGSQLDAMMIRSYLQDGCSIPKSSKVHKFKGAVSMGVPGVYENVLKFDVASLYPSIMLEYDIYDKKKDPKAHQIKILDYLRTERLKDKHEGRIDLSNARKIIINSFYGFMGANYLLFNYPKGAEEVTYHGREINLKGITWGTGWTLKEEIKEIKNKGKENEEIKYHWVLDEKVADGKGYDLVNTDTDSFSMSNGERPTEEHFNELLEDLNKQFPKLIVWEDDGLFDQVIVVAAKNYVLVKDGKVKYKGSSLTDQKKEPILIEFLHKALDILLKYDKDSLRTEYLRDLYKAACKLALDIKDINKWVTKKTVTEKMMEGSTVAGAKAWAACQEALDKGVRQSISEQDKIWVYQYIAGQRQKKQKGEPQFYKKTGEPIMEDVSGLRFFELFDGDYDKWHYVARVWDTLDILSNVIEMKQFPKYHNKTQRKLLE